MTTLDYLLAKYDVGRRKSPIGVFYTRWYEFPRLIRELGFTKGAEVGVGRGSFTRNIIGRNPQLKLFAVDAWKLYKDYDGYPYINQAKLDAYYQKAKGILKPYNVKFVKDFSKDAVRKFANGSLDFVYIDANNRYEYSAEDIKAWSKKVKKGGLIAGNNYCNGLTSDFGGMQTYYGVKKAVDEWVKKNQIRHLFTLAKDRSPSWMFVNA
jgi:hypothetical protein